jgi:hypothetical protein
MDKQRTKLGSMLFKMAEKIYPEGQKGDSFRKEWGNLLFKMAAKISPDKKK